MTTTTNLADKLDILADLVRGVTPDVSGGLWATGLDTVQALRMIEQTAQAAQRDAVAQARAEGESWEAIARALAVTRQAAWEKYS